jgi:tetratricopeptide (TPR) repeat protein
MKIFWPVDLAVFYTYRQILPTWQIFGAASIVLGISILAIYAIKKAPFLFVGWFWYLGTLVPVIGLMQVGNQSIADRYTYFPSIGIAIILACGIYYLLPKEKLHRIILIPATAIILVASTFLTWQQCGYWKNSISLFTHVVQVTNDNYLAHNSLGSALAAEGKNQEAIAHFREAVRITPSSFAAFNNLGVNLEKQLNHNEAIFYYRRALLIDPQNSGIYFNLGVALGNKGELKEAIEHFRQAINLKPDYEEARRALKLAIELEKR